MPPYLSAVKVLIFCHLFLFVAFDSQLMAVFTVCTISISIIMTRFSATAKELGCLRKKHAPPRSAETLKLICPSAKTD